VELSSSSTTQSGHHLRTVQTTAEGTPFSESMNTVALCDFDMRALEEHLTLTYLLTYLLYSAPRPLHLKIVPSHGGSKRHLDRLSRFFAGLTIL